MYTAQLGGTSMLTQCMYTTGENEVWAMNRDHRVFHRPKEGKFLDVEKEEP